jgi:hypothetical protein
VSSKSAIEASGVAQAFITSHSAIGSGKRRDFVRIEF